MTDEKTAKHRSTILQLYAVFILSLIGSLIPNMLAQGLSCLFLLALIIAVPIYQWAAPSGSLLENHMRYLNVTIWMGSLFLLISILILGYWVYQQSDQSAFNALYSQAENGNIMDMAAIEAAMQNFLQANMPLLLKASIICVGPTFLYIAYRTSCALSRAVKGYRMGDLTQW